MKTQKMLPCRTTDAVFYVTYYEKGMISGWLFHQRMERPIRIKSIPQFLFALDSAVSQDRSPVNICTMDQSLLSDPPVATLRIRVLFREHHTWQGCIVWEEQKMEATFLSVLELIEIMDEILGE